jgi:hypothetical protein
MTLSDQEGTTAPNGNNLNDGPNGVPEEGFEIGHTNGDVDATLASLKNVDKNAVGASNGEKKNFNNGI